MSTAIPLSSLGTGKTATFDQPFEMMAACHERLDRMLALLEKLRAHLPRHGADDQARQAAKDVMRYFDQAAPQHHRDEELHVFPPLLAQADAQTVDVVRQLQREHAAMEAGWVRVREVLAAIAGGSLAALSAQHAEVLDAFAALYSAHIAAEERIAYPAARALLNEAQVQAIGQEMARRRGA
jgi:hemerythrin-like domain-containing protein